ncbi:uncharacterized protein [Porites lutea]|uniref:uncharacterized protein isoform X2 n=1 Tax=Porites lutea TaxID=51062 RepID=UPI003CC581E3
MARVFSTSHFLLLFWQTLFTYVSASVQDSLCTADKIERLNCSCNITCSQLKTSSFTTLSPKSYFEFQSTKAALNKRQVRDHIMMDGFNGEMLLDVEKRPTDSLRPLNISISPPERNVSGRFFNFHDYKPTFKLDASEKGRVTLTGGPLMAPYIMDQFHFHVYCTREEAEENTLDRVQVPGEVQGEENTNTEIATFENLIDYISQDENRTVSTTAAIEQLSTPLSKRNAPYQAYRGNLVEPIKCKNCVDVFVMEERFTVSVKQMMEFRKAPHCVQNDWSF